MAYPLVGGIIASFFKRMLGGVAAVISQSYGEVNKKRGVQFSASRLIENAAPNQVYYSSIETGDLPVDLKSREFAFSGASLIADMYQDPTYTGGVVETDVFNANGFTIQPSPRLFTIRVLAVSDVTDEGTKFAATIYALGSNSQQSKGVPNSFYGTNYILKPNTKYLLKFYSTDVQAQNIAARIDMYEGELDYYPS